MSVDIIAVCNLVDIHEQLKCKTYILQTVEK